MAESSEGGVRLKRFLLRRIASWLYDISTWTDERAGVLQRMAQPKRVKPLAFETDSQRMLREITENAVQWFVRENARRADFFAGDTWMLKHVRVADEPFVMNKIRIPDADA